MLARFLYWSMCEKTMLDSGEQEHISAAIVRGIAMVESCDPVELDLCLANHVDSDALEALFTDRPGSDSDVTVEMRIADFDVTVGPGREVTAAKRCDQPEHCTPVVSSS